MLDKIKQQLVKTDFEYFIKFKKEKDSRNFEDLWKMKLLVRESVREWLIASNLNVKIAEDATNACAELVENGIKFSKPGTEVYVSINIQEKNILIEVCNDTEEEKKKDFIQFLDYILTSDKDISELYLERMLESFKTGESKLGIIKILMETKADIELKEKGHPETVFLSVNIDLSKMAS